ncbi:YgiW/YdeI family stress tolerance OB fold protein [Haemophilus parahaemolyticus]|uniref:YgiW/YdeI family stress tolerance OB fold protein n=2 Tax=Haemophilus parahaemolyticus TaxID=735 RepID=A0AAE6JSJ6_HAEPH|nr:YgiW/YdeI family stress tolerance OB fold protein [Haemophilus parahaemolyticus]EIJ67513.1 TIGR00156 family protein [Haemophilus parahaemolyticus HK385]OOR95545.1 TIGR00156 family protein [Haemophilus parahaemolyticus]QEN11319.1 YgiW/YdeI family stress tolerance OB fold protein [Haemophilus parahaemolyticus]QRP12512.1 YgiW/YdeI family stress tolerance OB fold protein [Haemophilus parahaemolyticus]STO66692.1 putative outer membrane protein [Haemophilus parahaemolyticus HK385]
MKKFALAAILALSTTSAFAGFNGNTTPNGSFQSGTQSAISVKQALKAADNSMITLEGNITQQIDDDEFWFSDSTGQIKVEIERHVWNGLNVGQNDKVRIFGKLDNEMFEKAELQVLRIEKAN